MHIRGRNMEPETWNLKPEDGWVRQFTATEPRLSEMVELYQSLGLEVRLGPATPEPGQDCTACLVDNRVKTIYTRERR